MLNRTGLCKQLILVSTALLIGSLSIESVGSAPAQPVDNKHFYLFMRPRLGYFHRFPTSSPYSKIYEEYFARVIQKNDDALKDIPADDWRHFRPNVELCTDFLIGLQVKEYILSKPFDIVPLDACLEWLFDTSSEKKLDEDRMSSEQKRELALLSEDKELQRIYQETQFREVDKRVPQNIQDLVYDYIKDLLKIYSDNPRNGCHSLWLEAYNEFVEKVLLIGCEEEDESKCQHYGYGEGATDSYLRMIADSTVHNARSCYSVMQKQIHGLMEAEYEDSNSGPTSFAKRFKSRRNRAARQSESKRWPREMMGILQLASGVDPEQAINLGQCVIDLEHIKDGEPETVGRFTKELAKYALENVDMSKSENDPNGRARYGRAVTKLCRPYTDPKLFLSKTGGVYTNDNDEQERKPFDFYHIIYSLVRLTNHEATFGITKEQFEEDVIKYAWEPLYLATFACQIISVTWGVLTHDSNQEAFEVKLRPGSSKIIADWPISVMTLRLPALNPGEAKAEAKVSFAPAAIYGRKYKLFGGRHRETEGPPTAPPKSPELPSQSEAEPEAPPASETPVTVSSVETPKPSFWFGRRQVEQPQAPASPAPPSSLPSAVLSAPADNMIESNKFLSLYNSNKSPEAQTPAPPMMSMETIEMFKKLHGRYPQMSEHYKRAYPELPEDTSGTYAKELGDRPLFAHSSVLKSKFSPYSSREWQEEEQRQQERTAKTKPENKGRRTRRAKPRRREEEPADDELAF